MPPVQQLRLPWAAPPPTRRTIVVAGRVLPLVLVRHPAARRYVLRVTAAGVVRVTMPRRGSIAAAMAFAGSQSAWIAREWARRRAAAEWGPGTQVWYRGNRHPVRYDPPLVGCGPTSVVLRAGQSVREALQAHWRAEAAAELPDRCLELGVPHGLVPRRIVVRDQQTRWGSCSTRGTIALNWRLVQMPSPVADYVMLHELVHLEHPNHSRRYWRRVADVCEGWQQAERWLRAHGRDLL